ncbi:hypothetical protein DM82_2372 [Burkholderia oklahomensis]|uniref:Uncharacterized protein n=1 Tax=Burkholderia oklahomensis TaxID=342113 RepID=A0AAI8B668_9BURK|nr:hypothetical protein DM82_2372 [Burkholderia oklahomensis]
MGVVNATPEQSDAASSKQDGIVEQISGRITSLKKS